MSVISIGISITLVTLMGIKERRKGATFERAIARLLGVERAGTSGKPDRDPADLEHPILYIQCKARKSVAACRWLEKTKDECPEDKIPIVISKEDRGKPFIMMDLENFLDFYGKPYAYVNPVETEDDPS